MSACTPSSSRLVASIPMSYLCFSVAVPFINLFQAATLGSHCSFPTVWSLSIRATIWIACRQISSILVQVWTRMVHFVNIGWIPISARCLSLISSNQRISIRLTVFYPQHRRVHRFSARFPFQRITWVTIPRLLFWHPTVVSSSSMSGIRINRRITCWDHRWRSPIVSIDVLRLHIHTSRKSPKKPFPPMIRTHWFNPFPIHRRPCRNRPRWTIQMDSHPCLRSWRHLLLTRGEINQSQRMTSSWRVVTNRWWSSMRISIVIKHS